MISAVAGNTEYGKSLCCRKASQDEENMKQFLEAGKIVGTHGVRGELRVEVWSDSPEVLKKVKALYFEEGKLPLKLVSRRVHKSLLLLTLADVQSVEQADMLRGKIIYLDRRDVSLEPGRHFVQDLIGLSVKDGNSGVLYGTLTDVLRTGANDVYQIRDGGGKEYLFPAVPHMIQSVDLEKGLLLVLPIPGIFDQEGLSDAN